MHLVIISPFPPAITGIGQYGYHITRAIANTGIFSRITVLTGKSIDANTPPIPSTSIIPCWKPNALSTGYVIFKQIKQLKPDLVWLNLGVSAFGRNPFSNLSGMSLPFLLKKAKIPAVTTLHELVPLVNLQAVHAPGGPFKQWGANLITYLGTRSDITCLTLQQYTDWLNIRGVDCMHIPIGAYHEPQMLPQSDTNELLFFTTLAPFKGLDDLLSAFSELKPEFPDLKLTIAGIQHERFPGYGKDLRQKFNENQNIHWLGIVPEDNVRHLFQNAKLVILPYTASTGSSSVVYQAAAWGRAVIASDLNEHKNLAAENNLMLNFFKTGSKKELAAKIRSLLTNKELHKHQILENFKSIQKLRPDVSSAHYLQAFHKALLKHDKALRPAAIQEKLKPI